MLTKKEELKMLNIWRKKERIMQNVPVELGLAHDAPAPRRALGRAATTTTRTTVEKRLKYNKLVLCLFVAAEVLIEM
eukprot:3247178-Heterocapsa_arctica.AAC.1